MFWSQRRQLCLITMEKVLFICKLCRFFLWRSNQPKDKIKFCEIVIQIVNEDLHINFKEE